MANKHNNVLYVGVTNDIIRRVAKYKQISQNLDVDFYFADPYKSCQRGLNENHNRLIRQYIPKKIDFENIDNQHIDLVQNKINNRPRKKLGFLTSNEKVLLILQNNKPAFLTNLKQKYEITN